MDYYGQRDVHSPTQPAGYQIELRQRPTVARSTLAPARIRFDTARPGRSRKNSPTWFAAGRVGSPALGWPEMSSNVIIDGLIFYLGLIVLLTFHEYGHAWMASKCGDDTAKDLGRCSLNPIVHIDPIGTVLMPLLMIGLSIAGSGLAGFLIGWAKPVPVNVHNLRNPKLDDILISMAGPWMNLLLAVVFMGLARICLMAGLGDLAILSAQIARLSLLLCFFNLIPIPPLDGSHVLRVLIGMSYETYRQFARFGFIVVILALQMPFVIKPLRQVTSTSWRVIGSWFGVEV